MKMKNSLQGKHAAWEAAHEFKKPQKNLCEAWEKGWHFGVCRGAGFEFSATDRFADCGEFAADATILFSRRSGMHFYIRLNAREC